MTDYLVNFTDETKDPILIKPYTSNGQQTPSSAVPLHASAVTADTSLVLYGKGFINYGEIIQENLVRTLEHFAYPTPPAFPIEGQVWYQNDTKQLWVCTDPGNVVELDRWTKITLSTANNDLDMNGFRILNLGNATADTDALNRQTGDLRYVNATGDTMTGNLIIQSGDITIQSGNINVDTGSAIVITDGPTLLSHATNKNYVDTKIFNDIGALSSVYVNTNGDTMTGNLVMNGATIQLTNTSGIVVTGSATLTMGGNRIENVAEPLNGTDVATKGWVENLPGIGGGTDGVVTGGSFNSGTNQLVLTRSNSLSSLVIGGIAASTHTHISTAIIHDLSVIPYMDSFFVRDLYTAPGYPNISLGTILQTLDSKVTTMSQPFDVGYGQGDGATITFDTPSYTTGDNRLQVYINGIKQYANQRGGVDIEILDNLSQFVKLNTDTQLGAGVYTFTISVDGVTYTTPSITAPGGVYTFYDLLNDINATLNTNNIPATANFRSSVIEFRSDTTGRLSQVRITAETLFTAISTAISGSWSQVPFGSYVDITGVNTTTNEFQVAGDYTAYFTAGTRFSVDGSTGNDNIYTVSSNATFNTGTTTIPVAVVPNATVDGSVVFNRTLSYAEPDPAYTSNANTITFTTAPLAGDIIEFVYMK